MDCSTTRRRRLQRDYSRDPLCRPHRSSPRSAELSSDCSRPWESRISPRFEVLLPCTLHRESRISSRPFQVSEEERDCVGVWNIAELGSYTSATAELTSDILIGLFYKPRTTLTGPETPIIVPRVAKGESSDYEVELCVCIGRPGRDIPIERAYDHVAGYLTANDVSYIIPSRHSSADLGPRRRSPVEVSSARSRNPRWASPSIVS